MAVDDIGRGSDLQFNGQVQPVARQDGSFPGASSCNEQPFDTNE